MKRQQSGVALVLVLWVITLLTVIAGNFAYSMRSEAQIAGNLVATAQVKARADAGVQRAMYELMKPLADGQRWQGDGSTHGFALDGLEVQVSIQNESGKIDLNEASDALLQGLFKSVGLGEEDSTALLQAVLDWRDADNLKRLNGAEEDDYRLADKRYIPSNGPFGTVDELQRVLGMTPELYRKLAPALTVYSGQPAVNTTVAPRNVLMAIPGINPALVEQYLVQRQTMLAANQKAPALPFVSAFTNASAISPAYAVSSVAKLAGGAIFVRHSVVRLVQDAKRPIAVLAWSEGEAEQLTGK